MKAILILAAVIIVLGGGIAFAFLNRNASQSQTTQTERAVSQDTAGSSLQDLLSTGKKQTCTFSDPKTGTNGTLYMANGSMRGDIISMVNEERTSSHILIADNIFYVWMEGQTSGLKSSFEEFNTLQQNPNIQQSFDLNRQVAYDCGSWTVDTAQFAVPTTVQFIDMTNMMESLPSMDSTVEGSGEGTDPDTSSQCASCDPLSGSAKAQCLQALNCQ